MSTQEYSTLLVTWGLDAQNSGKEYDSTWHALLPGEEKQTWTDSKQQSEAEMQKSTQAEKQRSKQTETIYSASFNAQHILDPKKYC